MNSELAICVEGLGKRFTLQRNRSLKGTVLGVLGGRRARPEMWALRDISFQVRKGETLGIIGANGAGKSTFLSVVAGTMAPTVGRIETSGAISSLLELGAGFHPDLTGRENVFLNGAIMGLSRAQMRARFDAIVAFAGIGDYIDQPVRHYSSGMYVRLGFAVAVEVDPDILLIDEVLAVGDADFQRKCLDRIDGFRRQGKTMLIVSHDLATIQRISDRILFLEQGTVRGLGRPDEMIRNYQGESRRRAVAGLDREWGTGEVRITGVTFTGTDGKPAETFAHGARLQARIAYRCSRPIDTPVFGFAIADARGQVIFGNNTQIEEFPIERIDGEGAVSVAIGPLMLAAGSYLFSCSVHSADHRTNYHRLDNSFSFQVTATRPFEGCYMGTQWARDREGTARP